MLFFSSSLPEPANPEVIGVPENGVLTKYMPIVVQFVATVSSYNHTWLFESECAINVSLCSDCYRGSRGNKREESVRQRRGLLRNCP